MDQIDINPHSRFMPFECKKYHGKCKAKCCGIVPIKFTLWKRKQNFLQRKIKEIIHGKSKEGRVVIPITEDLYCPFLTEGLSCAIYADRPEVCRKFGDETHELLCCPMQDKDGNPKSRLKILQDENPISDIGSSSTIENGSNGS
jgi:Fe-S-cluster containining protein